jgi:hypothetical protein
VLASADLVLKSGVTCPPCAQASVVKEGRKR